METSGCSSQYCRDKPAVNNDIVAELNGANNSNSFNFKQKQQVNLITILQKEKNVKIVVPLKHLNNIWSTLIMHSINCEINLILNCSANYVISSSNIANQVATIVITDTKLYVPVVT